MFSHFDTLFTRMNANLDRFAIVPLAFVAILGLAVVAAFALETDTATRAAAALLQLDG
ncbi:hypothetical protein sos41_41490 [Alphaproteobacteria bacterium SO-S41]|nr:hypothetical protein sos41_41490 [Alphaproteobacteria bacterium SO-S41]